TPVGQAAAFWHALAAGQSVGAVQQVTDPEPPSSDGEWTQLDTPTPTTHVSMVQGSPSLHSASTAQQLSASVGTQVWPLLHALVSHAPTAGQSLAVEHDTTPCCAAPIVGGCGLHPASASTASAALIAEVFTSRRSSYHAAHSSSSWWRAAKRTTSPTGWSSSLRCMRARCVSTVLTLMVSSAATCWLVEPRASSAN